MGLSRRARTQGRGLTTSLTIYPQARHCHGCGGERRNSRFDSRRAQRHFDCPLPRGDRPLHIDNRRLHPCGRRRLHSVTGSLPGCGSCHLGGTDRFPVLHIDGCLARRLFAWQLPLILFAASCLALAALASALPPTAPEVLSSAPISARTYRDRLLSLTSVAGTRLLLLSYLCWSAGMYIFRGLYPSWLVQHGLADAGVGAIGVMLFLAR